MQMTYGASLYQGAPLHGGGYQVILSSVILFFLPLLDLTPLLVAPISIVPPFSIHDLGGLSLFITPHVTIIDLLECTQIFFSLAYTNALR